MRYIRDGNSRDAVSMIEEMAVRRADNDAGACMYKLYVMTVRTRLQSNLPYSRQENSWCHGVLEHY